MQEEFSCSNSKGTFPACEGLPLVFWFLSCCYCQRLVLIAKPCGKRVLGWFGVPAKGVSHISKCLINRGAKADKSIKAHIVLSWCNEQLLREGACCWRPLWDWRTWTHLTGDSRQPQQVMDSTEGGTRRTITLHIFSFNSLTPRKEVWAKAWKKPLFNLDLKSWIFIVYLQTTPVFQVWELQVDSKLLLEN